MTLMERFFDAIAVLVERALMRASSVPPEVECENAQPTTIVGPPPSVWHSDSAAGGAVTGTAYRTSAVPRHGHLDLAGDCAVYAVYPPAIHADGVTGYVAVQAGLHDAGVYPCDETGLLLSWHLLGCMVGADHRRVLRAAGYELEEVRRVCT